MERELGIDAALAALTETEPARTAPPPEPARTAPPATAAPRKSSRARKASPRVREAAEASEPRSRQKKRVLSSDPQNVAARARHAARGARKKARLEEFNDLERRVAALIGRVTRLEEERRRRRGDDGLDDDDAQSSRVADAL